MTATYQAPADYYTPALPSDPGAELHLIHDHEHGTRLEGSGQGDGALEILQPMGFRYRRGAGVHVPGTRDRFAPLDQLDRAARALREAGHRVAVTVDDRWRTAAVREADRADRAAHRVERLTERANRQQAKADTREAAGQRITDRYGDEPVKADHHSTGRHLNALDRAQRHREAATEHRSYARHLAGRAAGAYGHEQAKHDPRAILRRIEALEAQAGRWQRNLDRLAAERADADLYPRWRRRCTLELERVREDIAHQRGKLAAWEASQQFVPWGPDHVRRGDLVNVFGMWCEVSRVNTKSVTVRRDTASRVPWDKIHGRCRDGLVWDTPHGTPTPVAEVQAAAKWNATVNAPRRSFETDSDRRISRHVGQALRLVLRLPAEAGEPEVAAFPEPETVRQRRAFHAVCWSVFRRLERGETFAAIAANPPPVEVPEPGWRMPAGDVVDRLVGQLRPGDIVAGVYVRRLGPAFGAAPRELDRSVAGPVLEVGECVDRFEAGRWRSVVLAAGPDGEPVRHEFKDHEWFGVCAG